MKNRNHILILLFLFSFISCKKPENELPVYLGYDYFPQDTSHFITYRATVITYDDFYDPPQIDTSVFLIKEVNESYFYDNEGRKCIRLERLRKDHDTTSWFLSDVWTACVTNKWVEKTEENVKYIKLTFPLKEGAFWDGNISNTLEETEYSIENLHNPYSIEGFSFDSTVIVMQKEDKSLISQELQYEIYAKNIGMIFKKHLSIETETNGEVRSGIDLTYEIIDYN